MSPASESPEESRLKPYSKKYKKNLEIGKKVALLRKKKIYILKITYTLKTPFYTRIAIWLFIRTAFFIPVTILFYWIKGYDYFTSSLMFII